MLLMNNTFEAFDSPERSAITIPIPKKNKQKSNSHNSSQSSNNNNHNSHSYAKTPSLKSVLDQKKCSTGSIRSNDSSSTTATNPNQMAPSLISASSSFESCDDSHPLDLFHTFDDIDENFFNNDITTTAHDNFEPVEPIQPVKRPIITKKASFVSNLSSSIKNFTAATVHNNNKILFDIQPRLTDDKVPKTTLVQRSDKDTELKTFKITSIASPTSTTTSSSASIAPSVQAPSTTTGTISIVKNRELRINSQFLRLYSYESSSRKKGYLPEVSHADEEDYINHKFRPHDPQREFALFVRQRLWQCVVLPPRDDLNIHPPEYVYTGPSNSSTMGNNETEESNIVSLIRKKGDVKPWIQLEDEKISKQKVLRPCGVLGNDTQFTVKGWCNERWLPHTA